MDLDKLIVIGDRVLVKPIGGTDKTKSGLYLPAGYKDKEEIQKGYILKCGPGYALPSFDDPEEWKPKKSGANYLPLQVKAGSITTRLQVVVQLWLCILALL